MILKFDYRYTIGSLFVKLGYRTNYRKVVRTGLENIPENTAIIYAPNHRNAIIDGFNLVYICQPQQIVFLARADIFKNKLLKWFLSGVKVIPVYRIRDGKENLGKNNEIFATCATILEKNYPICLFPEAKHSPSQHLLPIQKGIPRIALPTEAYTNFKLNINIIPVSTYYTDIHGFLSDVYVNFGKPIKVVNNQSDYENNPNLAINNLRHDLDHQLRNQMVDISNEAYYHFYNYCIDLCGKKIAKKHFADKKDGLIQAYKAIVSKLDYLYANDNPKFLEIIDDFGRAFSILSIHKLSTKDDVEHPQSAISLIIRSILLIIAFPVALAGLANTIFPIAIYIFLRKKIKDEQFISSIRTVMAIFIIPIFYLIQFIVFGCISHNWLLALLYFVTTPFIFYFGCYWRKWVKSTFRAIKVRMFSKKHAEDWLFIKTLINFDI
jgi:1-acyl-sn-glycerol-3-phosphate acyltransferase